MATSLLLVGIALAAGPGPESAADAVTLRDGRVALGQVVEPASRGAVHLLIRREWASENLPEWSSRWQAAERAETTPARRQRRDRLEAWRSDRADAPAGDAVLAWIDLELARLADDPEAGPAPLLLVRLKTSDVRSIAWRPEDARRMLRQGWIAGLDGPESMSLADLKRRLEARGFAQTEVDSARVDHLLPLPTESDGRWRLRRAATEAAHDPGLRFIRHQGLVLPEGEGGAAAGTTDLLGTIRSLLDDTAAPDPLAARFREVEARRRSGLILTRLEVSPDLSAVAVDSTLWVRLGDGLWRPALSKSAAVRTDSVAKDAGADLAADPRVEAAFGLVESLGLGAVAPEIKQRSLNVGAATREALARVREAFGPEIEGVALPIESRPRPD